MNASGRLKSPGKAYKKWQHGIFYQFGTLIYFQLLYFFWHIFMCMNI